MDKRAAVRVPVRVRAQCRTGGIVIDGLVEDLSRSGLFLRAPAQVDPGVVAEIHLDLPDDEHLLLSAEIVRVVQDPRPGLAFRFVDDSERSRRPLANFIMRQHATHR